jgi:dTDP-4-dehydrorhamnose 3,5-epimerase
MNEEKYVIKLEKHDTKDISDKHVNGSLSIIWKDDDSILNHSPKMVYVSSVNRGEIKGPHIHMKRNSYFTCIEGKVIFVLKNSDGKYTEIESSPENGIMIFVPSNVESAHKNIHDGISRVLALADISWKSNDNEMKNTKFDDYEWKKWD